MALPIPFSLSSFVCAGGAGTRANRARAMMAEQGAQAVDNSGHNPMRQGGRGGQPKRQKNGAKNLESLNLFLKNITFQSGHPCVEPHITQTLYMSKKILLPLLGTKTIRYEIQKFRWPYGQRRQAHQR
tara:strand:+ start:169 stop:552 length:384 start_codon:yes stop_codon:yes gene_type:complete